MKEFLDNILGTEHIGHFAAAFLFAIIGVIISLLVHSTNRDKDATRTPYKFDFLFLVRDNSTRIFLNILLILATLRFYPEIKKEELSMIGAFTVGLGWDKLNELLRNYCLIDKK